MQPCLNGVDIFAVNSINFRKNAAFSMICNSGEIIIRGWGVEIHHKIFCKK
jgi:hypothetical protein